MQRIDISICIITYKRPEGLRTLIESLLAQKFKEHKLTYEIVVVDNDKDGSAEYVVKEYKNVFPFIKYEIEPELGIPYARNRSVKIASGRYLAFIDDDEFAAENWLESLFISLVKYDADAVFGPVEPILPEGSPDWIRKGGFFERPKYIEGAEVPSGRTSNALVKKKWTELINPPFDTSMRFTGGTDSKFFKKIKKKNGCLIWTANAVVYEKVDPSRLNTKWLLMRALRGGQCFAKTRLSNSTILEKIVHILYRAGLASISMTMAMIAAPFGYDKLIWWLRKFFSNIGQISVVFTNSMHEEYSPEKYRKSTKSYEKN